MSQYLERMALGDTIEVKGPLGHFMYEGRGDYRNTARRASPAHEHDRRRHRHHAHVPDHQGARTPGWYTLKEPYTLLNVASCGPAANARAACLLRETLTKKP